MNRAQDPIPPIAQWLFPSIKDVLFLGYLFGPSLLNESGVLYDSDTGWHIRHGETILRTWTLPTGDYFSYTNYGKPWFSWEWLGGCLPGPNSQVRWLEWHRILGQRNVRSHVHIAV